MAGAWLGPKKPSEMSHLLKPVIKKLDDLLHLGIEAHTPGGNKQVKAVLLKGIFDLPAKAAIVNNMKQFNGKHELFVL